MSTVPSYSFGGPVAVHLVLLDIFDELSKDSRDFKAWVESEVLAYPIPAPQLLEQDNDAELLVGDERSQLTKNIQTQVLKYLQLKDKYTALTSMLLKSQSFHRHYPWMEANSNIRTVVHLPRTQFQKPYIPLHPSSVQRNGKEEDVFPLSVSHQFPFVGLLQFDDDGDIGNRTVQGTEQDILRPAQHIGLDVVVFDDYNPRIYDNQEEFIDTFQEYFTAREWKWIQSVDAVENQRLQEFYLRWSIKEAYTKALGVGMGKRFDSFECHLQEQSQNDNEGIVWNSSGCKCASDAIRTSPQHPSHFTAVVKHLDDTQAPRKWLVSFLPLHKGPKSPLMVGCACICAGPLPLDSTSALKLRVEWSSLDALVDWHLKPL
eukprot:Nitzschia sp. Nitz4//scaffold17_size182527//9577//10698//NITZ4_001826-RA/size182527-processed-gene-0.84-mRNA-1//1//CDS//3329539256//1985//frame0